MTREAHQGRRQARAEALEQRLGSRNGAYYVDVAGLSPRGYYTAAVIHQGTQVDGLTFKATSSSVLDEGDDVLENVNLVEAEKAERNVENRKGKPGYQPYDDTEVDEFGIVKKKSLLYKYDEEIEGVKREKFSIGAGPTEADKERELELVRMKLKQKQKARMTHILRRDSLIMPAPQIATEYYTPDEMATFKKTKRKVRKTRKRQTFKADDLVPLPGHGDDKKDHGSRRRRENNFTEPVFVNPQSQQFFDDAAKPPEEEGK
ncbi:hypothetical protein HPB51_007152 [Rhipicephalus microplus]|uniref:Uncharacterized protein n=1 Tax=Rhipicephalus microplus TaxID=6941 RepID=A0A9J6E057_RHIMP|nr:hypothetical protein HPB51_007152 [Rhipicephalus microplus]